MADAADTVHVRQIEGAAGGELSLAIDGSLSIETLKDAWDPTLAPIRRGRPERVAIDVAGLDYCDGAGLGLFAEVRRELAGLGWHAVAGPPQAGPATAGRDGRPGRPRRPAQLRPPKRPGLVVGTGRATATVLAELYAQVAFLGEVCVALAWAVLHPRRLRWGDLLTTADKVGTDAIPVVCLLGFLIGAILAFQSAPPMEKFGGRDLIPTLVSISRRPRAGPADRRHPHGRPHGQRLRRRAGHHEGHRGGQRPCGPWGSTRSASWPSPASWRPS